MPNPQPPQINHRRLTVKETAQRLGLKPKTIYNLLSKKSFPIPVKRIRGSIGFLERDINKYLEDL